MRLHYYFSLSCNPEMCVAIHNMSTHDRKSILHFIFIQRSLSLSLSLCQSVKNNNNNFMQYCESKSIFLQCDSREISHTLCLQTFKPLPLVHKRDRHIHKFFVWISLLSTTCEWINSIIKDNDFYRFVHICIALHTLYNSDFVIQKKTFFIAWMESHTKLPLIKIKWENFVVKSSLIKIIHIP